MWVIRLLLTTAALVFTTYLMLSIDDLELLVYDLLPLDLRETFLFTRLYLGICWSAAVFCAVGFLFSETVERMVRIAFMTLVAVGITSLLYCYLSQTLIGASAFSLFHLLMPGMIVWIGLLLPIGKRARGIFSAFSALLLIPMALPFIFSPPDLDFGQWEQQESFNPDAFEHWSTGAGLHKETRFVAFYSTGCGFCKRLTRKLSRWIVKEKMDTTVVQVAFMGAPDSSVVKEYYRDNGSFRFPYVAVDVAEFLEITNGSMPLLLQLDDGGNVVNAFRYRSFDDIVASGDM